MYHPSKFRKDYTSIDFDKAVTGHPLEKKTKLICAKILTFTGTQNQQRVFASTD